ncbi:MAG: hypothetical protein NVSMB48_00160 [Marmoricola sp.]
MASIKLMRLAAALAITTASVAGMGVGSSPADAASPPATSQDYSCDVQTTPSAFLTVVRQLPDVMAVPEKVTAKLSLSDVPSEAVPGQPLAVDGQLTFIYSDTVVNESKLTGASKATMGITAFPLEVTVGNSSATSYSPLLSGGPSVPIASPFALSVGIHILLPIPQNASGNVVVRLPSGATVNSTTSSSKVSFTTQINQDSTLMPTRDVACSAPKATVVVLNVPVSKQGGPASSQLPQSAQGQGFSSAPTGASVAGPTGASLLPMSGTSPTATGAITGVTTTATPTLAAAAIPRPTVSDKTFIPYWLLGLMALTTVYVINQVRAKARALRRRISTA